MEKGRARGRESKSVTETYNMMYVPYSLWNLCEMMDAARFSLQELKRGALEDLNLRHDGLGMKVLKGLI